MTLTLVASIATLVLSLTLVSLPVNGALPQNDGAPKLLGHPLGHPVAGARACNQWLGANQDFSCHSPYKCILVVKQSHLLIHLYIVERVIDSYTPAKHVRDSHTLNAA